MRFDEVLKAIGEFGPYQRRIYIFVCLPIIFIGISDVNNALLLFTPKHSCDGNDDHITQYSEKGLETTVNNSNSFIQDSEAGECFKRGINSSAHAPTSQPCTSWKYDKSVFVETFVSKYDLVCENSDTLAFMQIFMYSGALVGSLCQGFFADRFGRQRVIFYCIVLVFLSGFASAWSPNYYVFALLRFIQIMASRGVYLSSFILAIEIVGPSKRQWAGFLFNYPYSLGIAMLAGIGYGFRHWKYIQIASSAPMLLFFIYWWIIPESPRWLISHGRLTQARKTIDKMAACNKTTFCISLVENMTEKTDKPVKNHSIMNYFKHRSLLCQSLVIFFNCFVIFHCFFGFTLNTGNLAGNFYLNVLLSGLVDLPGYTIALVTSDRMGRKKMYILGMTVAGLSVLGSGITSIIATEEFKSVPIVLAMIGKVGMAIGYSVIYFWSAELFPTVVRNTGMGISATLGNIGYMVAPGVARLAMVVPGRVGPAIPLFVFGFLCLTAALFTLILPETQNANLPETVIHAEKMIRTKQYKLSKTDTVPEQTDIVLSNNR